mmetsp:Transcript_54885/g.174440  ORF Transcript_54885/g.174440 Transcript_54885/m.174440 type:complete len:252 (+) Transcript_54885:545-1300(+)
MGRVAALMAPGSGGEASSVLAVTVLNEAQDALDLYAGGRLRARLRGVSCREAMPAPTFKPSFGWLSSTQDAKTKWFFSSINTRVTRRWAKDPSGIPLYEVEANEVEMDPEERKDRVGGVTLMSPITSLHAPRARGLFGGQVHIAGPMVDTMGDAWRLNEDGCQGLVCVNHEAARVHMPTVVNPGDVALSLGVAEADVVDMENDRDAHELLVLLGLGLYNSAVPWRNRIDGSMSAREVAASRWAAAGGGVIG